MKQMYSEIITMLQLRPDYVILHIGNNGSKMKSCKQIFDEIMKLKCNMENLLASTLGIISTFCNAKANITIRSLNAKLNNWGIEEGITS